MKRTLFVMMIAAVLLAACGTQALAPMATEAPPYERPAMGIGGGDSVYVEESSYAAPEAPLPQGTMPAEDKSNGGNVDAAARERLVIRNADLSIVVKDPETSMTSISKLAEEMGGFVVSSNLYQTYTNNGLPVPEASIVIRVPAEKLNDALEKIKADAVEVQSENQSGQDVTSEYVDLESQLKNLEAAERQLTEIMSKAEKTEDVLNVFNQLTSIRGQIESIKGQMKYFEESAALSAVTVRLVAEETVQPIEVLGWKPEGTLRDAVQNLIYFWQDFVDFLIWFVVNFLPKLLTIGAVFVLPIWLIVRAIRNANRKRKAAQTPKE
ncbi:MAG: DUF4349 domain-containing protein [Chloroflexota bacterium]